MRLSVALALLLLSSYSLSIYTFNILNIYPQCDNPIRIGVCRNYVVYGLVNAASMYLCIKGTIKGTEYLSVQNQINLLQNDVKNFKFRCQYF